MAEDEPAAVPPWDADAGDGSLSEDGRERAAGHILHDYERPDGWPPREHIPTRREAAQRKFAQLLEEATANL